MRNYFVFLKKESMEFIRTKRFIGLGASFLIFAFASPFLARYMVEFLAAFMPAEQALGILFPDPVWFDSYHQFYSNVVQVITIVIIFMFMGTITAEKQKGTADLVLTKGLSYASFVLSKFTVLAIAIIVAMLVSIFIVYIYTLTLFEMAGYFENIIMGALLHTLLLIWLLSLTIFCSSVAKSSVIAALLAFAVFIAFAFLGSLPRIGTHLPISLANLGLDITAGNAIEGIIGSIAVATGFIILFLGLAIILLKRRERE